MKSRTKKDENHFNVSIRPKQWSKEELANVKSVIAAHQAQRTPEQKLRTRMLAIKYQMEEYAQDETINEKDLTSLEEFLALYLQTLDITFKRFAQSIDSTDGNLKKYLSGDRKFSTDLAFRFASFFHTTPDLWMSVNIKNELLSLKKEKKQTNKYKKYDYKKVLMPA